MTVCEFLWNDEFPGRYRLHDTNSLLPVDRIIASWIFIASSVIRFIASAAAAAAEPAADGLRFFFETATCAGDPVVSVDVASRLHSEISSGG